MPPLSLIPPTSLIGSSSAGWTRPDGIAGMEWFCLRTKNKRESLAAKQLVSRTGLEVFAPRLLVPKRTGGTRLEPLFPNYVFCRFDGQMNFRLVLSTPDIIGVVKFGERIPRVPEDVISFLKNHVSIPHPLAPSLKIGNWVEVLAGSFAGEKGKVISFSDGKQRAWVLLSLLGSEVRVCLPRPILGTEKPFTPQPSPLLAATPELSHVASGQGRQLG